MKTSQTDLVGYAPHDVVEDVVRRLEAAVAGEESAAAWLYDNFAARLYRRLRWRYSRSGGPDPEDLVHDLFLAVFRDRCRLLRELLQRPGPLDEAVLERRLWDLACGIATNRLRSHGTSKTGQLHEDFDRADRSPGAEQSVVDRDRLARLAACLEGRSSRVFLYFTLRFQDGLAPEEIVSLTGWSKKATYKLKQKLNEALDHCARELGWRA